MRLQFRGAAAIVLATTLASACGGGGDGPTGPDPNAVASVSLDVTTVSLNAIGATQQVTATAKNSTGATIAGKTFNYGSSSNAVATVSSSGLITAVTNGTATITATVVGGTANATAQVTVAQAVTAMTITPTTVPMTVGGTQQLTIAATDSRGNAVQSPTVAFTTSNGNVATVSNTGLITAVATGNATITATSGTVVRTAAVAVDFPDLILAADVTLSGIRSYRKVTIPANVTLTANAALTIRATGLVSIAGNVTGSCVPIDIGGDTAVVITGKINNGCAAGTASDLRLASTGELLLTNATITSSGDINLTNNPALTEGSFALSAGFSQDPFAQKARSPSSNAPRAMARRPFSFATQVGGVPFTRVENSTVAYFGGGTGPSPANKGTDGVNGTGGSNGRTVKMLLDGNAIFAGGTTLWGQDGGDGGAGTNQTNTNLVVNGGKGGDGGLIKVYITGSLTYTGAPTNTVRSGKGAKGGDASATTTANAALDPAAPSATANGGNGGQPGLIDIKAGGGITISAGALTLEVPAGGAGGAALASAADGVNALVRNASSPAQIGGSATAFGGSGGNTPNARLSASNVNGAPILIVPGGGAGGNASAIAGRGGNGIKPQKNGAQGGAISSNGGVGGSSLLKNLANAPVGNGGNGGNVLWGLGTGGNGWNGCVPGDIDSGGNGGTGGSATGARGGAGAGVIAGTAGTTRFETAGNGGNAGPGAGPGNVGAAGTNAVPGPIGSAINPNFTPGVAGIDCTPQPPPPNVSMIMDNVNQTAGSIPNGIQSLPLNFNNIGRGIISAQFTSPTFFGTTPTRFGVGIGGSITLKTADMLVDATLYSPKAISLCLTNSAGVSAGNPVLVNQISLGGQILFTSMLTSPNQCLQLNLNSQTNDVRIYSPTALFDFFQVVLYKQPFA